MKKMNRVYRKNISKLLAGAAALCFVLANTGASTILAVNAAVESAEGLAPGSITIEEPIALSEISLPESGYGTFSWAEGDYVPQSSQEYCQVIFTPYDVEAYADAEGFDPDSGTVTLYVEICVLNAQGGDEITQEEGAQTPSDTDSEEISEEIQKEEGPSQDQKEPQEGESLPQEGEVTPTDEPQAEEVTPTDVPQEGEVAPTDVPQEEGVTPKPSQEPQESPNPEVTQAPQVSPEPSPEVTPGTQTDPKGDAQDVIPGEEETQQPQETPEGELSLEEQQAIAAQNHTCQGITVTGDNLPWYVQFLVSSGEEYSFGNAEDANFFQSYEFELWDTLNNTEYKIPDGQYVVVTVPVLEGYNYVIEHLLDNGAVETIIPCVNGNTMIFATHSFSPFGIAGSKPLVGTDIAENGYSQGDGAQTSGSEAKSDPAATTAPKVPATGTPVDNSGSQSSEGSQIQNQTQIPAETGQASSGQAQVSTTPQSNSQQAVNTGDNTKILPLVILLAAAIVIIGAVLVVLKKKK